MKVFKNLEKLEQLELLHNENITANGIKDLRYLNLNWLY